MQWITSPAAMQRHALDWRRSGVHVAFVPTMGYLHEGHMSLVREARRRAGKDGIVVVSIYVNPTQFAPTEDLSRYPRDPAQDRRLCRAEGVDAVFAPAEGTMYLEGHSTSVEETALARGMEGVARPTHFRGVTTIVAKLFNIVLPDTAIFGAKDWQQAAVIRRMVRDLHFPVQIVVAPTVRERDGLALSSRNKYLRTDERAQARILSEALTLARERVRQRGRATAAVLKREIRSVIHAQSAARLDYVECFDPETLAPVTVARPGTRMALAVFVGTTRLIDNGEL
jgi:pantoate--beta-alanine ligase